MSTILTIEQLNTEIPKLSETQLSEDIYGNESGYVIQLPSFGTGSSYVTDIVPSLNALSYEDYKDEIEGNSKSNGFMIAAQRAGNRKCP